VQKIRHYLAEVPPKRDPDHRTTLESIARTVRVIGGMLQGLGDETKSAGGFLVRLATALWWLIEAAVPRGLTGFFFRRIFAMLTWFAIVMVVAGTFLNHAVQTVGFELLGISLVLWLIKDGFERFLLHGNDRRRGPRRTGFLAVAFAAAFAGLLAVTYYWINPTLHRVSLIPWN
jgi:hypothetical protein